MELAAKLDDIGKPAWIAVMVLGFVVFWPVGLAILGYLIWSGRMGCWQRARGHWHGIDGNEDRQAFRAMRKQWRDQWRHGRKGESSGNSAFDEYRTETLRRLEDEQNEFKEFLDRLRHAKDKAEFDQFMSDRRARPAEQPTQG